MDFSITRWLALVQLLVGVALAAKAAGGKQSTAGAPYLSDEYLAALKAQALTWKPDRNFHKSTTESFINRLIGHSQTLQNARSIKGKDDGPVFGKSNPASVRLYPESFDARSQWPFCNSTISRIQDTGLCASHWAVSVVQSLADRVCIHSGGARKEEEFSVLHLMSCCKICGNGCQGGYPYQAWKFIESKGITTGGNYGSNKGCKPYSVQSPCKYKQQNSGCKDDPPPVLPICTHSNQNKCSNLKYGVEEKKVDKVILVSKIPNADEFTQAWTPEFIKKEIMNNGPVTGTMRVFEDFLSYRSGVYKPSKGVKKIDDLTVRIIGWGKEGYLDYWLAAVPWGKDFGDHGFVKIRVGTALLQIDRRIHAAVPKL